MEGLEEEEAYTVEVTDEDKLYVIIILYVNVINLECRICSYAIFRHAIMSLMFVH